MIIDAFLLGFFFDIGREFWWISIRRWHSFSLFLFLVASLFPKSSAVVKAASYTNLLFFRRRFRLAVNLAVRALSIAAICLAFEDWYFPFPLRQLLASVAFPLLSALLIALHPRGGPLSGVVAALTVAIAADLAWPLIFAAAAAALPVRTPTPRSGAVSRTRTQPHPALRHVPVRELARLLTAFEDARDAANASLETLKATAWPTTGPAHPLTTVARAEPPLADGETDLTFQFPQGLFREGLGGSVAKLVWRSEEGGAVCATYRTAAPDDAFFAVLQGTAERVELRRFGDGDDIVARCESVPSRLFLSVAQIGPLSPFPSVLPVNQFAVAAPGVLDLHSNLVGAAGVLHSDARALFALGLLWSDALSTAAAARLGVQGAVVHTRGAALTPVVWNRPELVRVQTLGAAAQDDAEAAAAFEHRLLCAGDPCPCPHAPGTAPPRRTGVCAPLTMRPGLLLDAFPSLLAPEINYPNLISPRDDAEPGDALVVIRDEPVTLALDLLPAAVEFAALLSSARDRVILRVLNADTMESLAILSHDTLRLVTGGRERVLFFRAPDAELCVITAFVWRAQDASILGLAVNGAALGGVRLETRQPVVSFHVRQRAVLWKRVGAHRVSPKVFRRACKTICRLPAAQARLAQSPAMCSLLQVFENLIRQHLQPATYSEVLLVLWAAVFGDTGDLSQFLAPLCFALGCPDIASEEPTRAALSLAYQAPARAD